MSLMLDILNYFFLNVRGFNFEVCQNQINIELIKAEVEITRRGFIEGTGMIGFCNNRVYLNSVFLVGVQKYLLIPWATKTHVSSNMSHSLFGSF